LKTIILTQKQNDSAFVQGVIGKELQAANIKVKDQAFQNIFTQYIGGGDLEQRLNHFVSESR